MTDTICRSNKISVKVFTNKPEYDYVTSVNGWMTDETIESYFVGQVFHTSAGEPFTVDRVEILR